VASEQQQNQGHGHGRCIKSAWTGQIRRRTPQRNWLATSTESAVAWVDSGTRCDFLDHLSRQRPGTASGITFVTLEDETGVANLVIRPHIWQRYRRVARGAAAMIAHGRLERLGEVIHVLVQRLDDLSELTRQIDSQSRDFH
jgi:DNA polymerase III alpha subunit